MIDLNSDMGERPEALADGSEERLMRLISSANIACGVHAGDPTTMEAVVGLAKKYGVGVGAHPSFPDRANFGRAQMHLPEEQISQTVFHQVRSLGIICERLGVELRHAKPHGALYIMAVSNAGIAHAIADGVARWSKELILVGLAGSKMLDVWRKAGFRVAAEAFADRRYEPDGSLRARSHPDALITDPTAAAEQALAIVTHRMVRAVDGSVIVIQADTVCVHSDTPGAYELLKRVRRELEQCGIEIAPFAM